MKLLTDEQDAYLREIAFGKLTLSRMMAKAYKRKNENGK